jgi:hypothetical protein
MEVNKLIKTKILNFKNNLNFVRKMKYFTQGVTGDNSYLIFYISYMRVVRLILLLFFYCTGSKGIGAKKNMQSIPLPFIILKTF